MAPKWTPEEILAWRENVQWIEDNGLMENFLKAKDRKRYEGMTIQEIAKVYRKEMEGE